MRSKNLKNLCLIITMKHPAPLDDDEHEQLRDILDFIRNLQNGKATCYLLLIC